MCWVYILHLYYTHTHHGQSCIPKGNQTWCNINQSWFEISSSYICSSSETEMTFKNDAQFVEREGIYPPPSSPTDDILNPGIVCGVLRLQINNLVCGRVWVYFYDI